MKYAAFFQKHLYPLFMVFALGCAAVLLFNDRFWMYLDGFGLCVAVAVIALLVHLVDSFKRHIGLLVFALLLLVAGIGWFAAVALPFSPYSIGIFDWWVLYGGSVTDYIPDFALLTSAAVLCAAVVVAALVQKSFWARLISGLGVIAALLALSAFDYSVSAFVLFFAAAYVTAAVTEGFYRLNSWRKQKKNGQMTAAFLLPVFLLTSVLTVVVPSREEPLNWQFVADAYQSVVDYFTRLAEDIPFLQVPDAGEFSLGATLGYNEDGDLGGSMLQSDKVALRIKLPERPQGGLYLTGSIQNVYTGNEWARSEDESLYADGQMLDMTDFSEFQQALDRTGYSDPLLLEAIAKPRSLTITYQDLRTRSVFYPTKTNTLDLLTPFGYKGGTLPDDKWGTVLGHTALKRAQGRNFSYDVGYLDINYQGNATKAFLLEQGNFSFLGYAYRLESLQNSPPPLTAEEQRALEEAKVFAPYVEAIRANYLNLPDGLPQRVHDLAEEITAGLNSDYQKLQAIEAYLQANYAYTLTPGMVPQGRDFVDYFLFDSKQGYCTYFATSMAVLARCVGIPTRYVQGFAARLDRSVGDGEYEVRNNEAHSWPEAYLEGVGWVQFEPTASRRDLLYSDWSTQFGDDGNGADNGPDVPESPDNSTPNGGAESPEEVIERNLNLGAVITAAAAALLFLAALAFIIYRLSFLKRYRKRYRKADYRSRVYMDFTAILFLLDRFGFDFAGGETLTAYVLRTKPALAEEDISLKAAAQAYTRMHYSGAEPTKKDYGAVHEARTAVERMVRKRFGAFRFLLMRLRLSRK